jgi:hypothetical protein
MPRPKAAKKVLQRVAKDAEDAKKAVAKVANAALGVGPRQRIDMDGKSLQFGVYLGLRIPLLGARTRFEEV